MCYIKQNSPHCHHVHRMTCQWIQFQQEVYVLLSQQIIEQSNLAMWSVWFPLVPVTPAIISESINDNLCGTTYYFYMTSSSQTGTTQLPRCEDKQYSFGVTILTLKEAAKTMCPHHNIYFTLLHTNGIINVGCCLFVHCKFHPDGIFWIIKLLLLLCLIDTG